MNTLPVTGEHCLYRPLRGVHHSGLSVPAYVEELLRAYAGTAHPRETGGLLLGWWDQSVPVVAYALEVKDPRATRIRWTRDEARAQAALAQTRSQGHKHVGYVGDWHSHPFNVGPRGSDLRELRRVSRQYDQPTALAVVRRRQRNIRCRLAQVGARLVVSRAGGGRGQSHPVKWVPCARARRRRCTRSDPIGSGRRLARRPCVSAECSIAALPSRRLHQAGWLPSPVSGACSLAHPPVR